MDLQPIKDALSNATPGRWEAHSNVGYCGIMAGDKPLMQADGATFADAALIANAPTWLAWLCDEVERLRGALNEAPMQALGQTNTAFARWCMEQSKPTGQEVRHG